VNAPLVAEYEHALFALDQVGMMDHPSHLKLNTARNIIDTRLLPSPDDSRDQAVHEARRLVLELIDGELARPTVDEASLVRLRLTFAALVSRALME
jgi:hypothetical protein